MIIGESTLRNTTIMKCFTVQISHGSICQPKMLSTTLGFLCFFPATCIMSNLIIYETHTQEPFSAPEITPKHLFTGHFLFTFIKSYFFSNWPTNYFQKIFLIIFILEQKVVIKKQTYENHCHNKKKIAEYGNPENKNQADFHNNFLQAYKVSSGSVEDGRKNRWLNRFVLRLNLRKKAIYNVVGMGLHRHWTASDGNKKLTHTRKNSIRRISN